MSNDSDSRPTFLGPGMEARGGMVAALKAWNCGSEAWGGGGSSSCGLLTFTWGATDLQVHAKSAAFK